MSFYMPIFEAMEVPHHHHQHQHQRRSHSHRHQAEHLMNHLANLGDLTSMATMVPMFANMFCEAARAFEAPAFREVVNVKGFKQEDLKITTTEDKKKLTVAGKSEVEEDGMTVTRNINKSFDLPEDCDLEKMENIFTPDGKLVIVAPKVKKPEEEVKESEEESDEDESKDEDMVIVPGLSDSDVKDIEDTLDNFKVSVDAKGFKPEDLSVELSPDGKLLTIKGQHEEKTENSSVSKKIFKTYTLPENVKVGEVTSSFSADGVLTVVAPKNVAIEEEEKPKSVPINVERN